VNIQLTASEDSEFHWTARQNEDNEDGKAQPTQNGGGDPQLVFVLEFTLPKKIHAA
jgi:hypothetical protein